MNASTQNHQATEISARQAVICTALISAVFLIAVSRESFWIDESGTGFIAMRPTLQSWWLAVLQGRTTELQSPFYSFYMWMYSRIFGGGEWTLRAAGLLWLVPGLAILLTGFSNPRERLAVFLAAASSPFNWYYAGEARPYAMYMGMSYLVFGAILRLADEALPARMLGRWLAIFLIGLVLLCGANMIGVLWAGCAIIAILIAAPPGRLSSIWKTGALQICAAAACLAALGAYYFWTLRLGARGTSLGTTTIQSAAFVFYEQLGLLGLGPSRTELREGGIALLRPYLIVLLTAVALTGALVITGLWQAGKRLSVRKFSALLVLVVGAIVLLFCAGVVLHWRVLGRHFAGIMPVWISLLGLGLSAAWARGRTIGKLTAAGYLAIALWSSLSLRFAARHARDDYRDAAMVARTALAGRKTVWWNAAEYGAQYYQVPLSSSPAGGAAAILVVDENGSSLSKLPVPDVIIASKRDVFDSRGAIHDYVAGNAYKLAEEFPAFKVFARANVR